MKRLSTYAILQILFAAMWLLGILPDNPLVVLAPTVAAAGIYLFFCCDCYRRRTRGEG